MWWPFNKGVPVIVGEEEAKPPRKELVVPKEHLLEVIQLSDGYTREKTKMARYLLWAKIEEIFPEISNDGCSDSGWTLEFVNATRAIVYPSK